MQSEVSQKDKDHYNILTHIYGIQKDVHEQKKKDTDLQNSLLDSVGEGEADIFLML